MKKPILSAGLLALGIAAISSCGKTTKGKLTNDWRISSYESTYNQTSTSGDVVQSQETADETTTSSTYHAVLQGDTLNGSSTGTLAKHDFTIKADGTWELTREANSTATTSSNTSESWSLATNSGTWSFVKKNKTEDFQKNEKVIFHTLKATISTKSTTTVPGQAPQTNSSSQENTYLSGEKPTIYTVSESRKKELQLFSEQKSTANDGSAYSATSVKMTLKQK